MSLSDFNIRVILVSLNEFEGVSLCVLLSGKDL
jgi:hypothetical protein